MKHDAKLFFEVKKNFEAEEKIVMTNYQYEDENKEGNTKYIDHYSIK